MGEDENWRQEDRPRKIYGDIEVGVGWGCDGNKWQSSQKEDPRVA